MLSTLSILSNSITSIVFSEEHSEEAALAMEFLPNYIHKKCKRKYFRTDLTVLNKRITANLLK